MTRSLHASFLATALGLLDALTAHAQHPTFTRLADSVEVQTTFQPINGVPFPSNGLIVLTRDSIVLVDTGWGPRNTKAVLKHIRRTWHRPVAACFSTHFHDDRTGGIDVLRKQGVRCMGTRLTRDLALKEKNPAPEVLLAPDTELVIDGVTFAFFHPGAGHTQDNMVVWLPRERILYGGCLVKSMEAGGLGNIADADLDAWPTTIRTVQARFAEARIVVPGHQAWGGTELLDHTLKLLAEHGN